MQSDEPGISSSQIQIPIEVKLKQGWEYNTRRQQFESRTGEVFQPFDELPKGSKIAYKVPALREQDQRRLSKPERDLAQYLQIILPPTKSASEYVNQIRNWPCLSEANVGPQVSLPSG